jgi:ribosomal protein S27AE
VSAEEIERNYARFGCHHIACGRFLHQPHEGAAPWLEEKMRGVAPRIEPVRHIIEGARAYASLRGLNDPHAFDYGAVHQSADRIHHLAREYDRLPLHDPKAESHFAAMRDEVAHQYDHLTNRMGVKVQVTKHDPYRNAHEMAQDLRDNKRIQVLGTAHTGGHPFFSDAENDRFRAVHDAFGHAATGRDFDGHGEEAAWHAHARMFGAHARGALASETRGQNGSVILHDRFGPQKIALLPQHLWTPEGAHTASIHTAETARVREGIEHSLLDPGRDYPVVGRDHDNGGHQYVVLDTGAGRGNYIWAPEHHVHVSSLAEDYRLHRADQEARAEQYGHGYGEETRAFYGDPNVAQGDRSEKSLTYKDYLQHMRQPREEEELPTDREYRRGYELAMEHAETPNRDFGEMDRAHSGSPHPEHFFNGYKQGWQNMPEQRVAVHLGFAKPGYTLGDTPKFIHLGHVSGNSIDVLHCPFCGSGAVIARSDGTIECGFCTSVFTVQVQPQYAAFPQTANGMPYPWPGQPDPGSVVAPGGDMPLPGDPMGAGGLGGAPADIAPDVDDNAPPWAQDDADETDADDDTGEEEDGSEDDSAPPFAKPKGDGSGKAKVKGKDKPPFGKRSFLNSRGAELSAEDYMRHLAILHARDPREMAETIKENRS